jgi:phosphohistidine swiveling domain-containing protein
MNKKPEKKDYARLFEWNGYAPFFITHVFVKAYLDINGLAFSTTQKWSSYMPKETIKITNKLGLELYGNKDSYESYKESLFETFEEEKNLFNSFLEKEELDVEILRKYFQKMTDCIKSYSKTEFFCTDLIYKEQENYPDSKEFFRTFEKFKIDGRVFANKVFLESDSHFVKIVKKISKSFEMDFDAIINYSSDEMVELVENGVKVEDSVIENRKKAHIVYVVDSKMYSFEGSEAEEIMKDFISSNQGKVLKGTTAMAGKVQGRAYVFKLILVNQQNIAKMVEDMNEGDVLIAETTEPRIISACNKASAIVTNQGGMMSHAAIVARELKIPCVVGTADATDLIKTGDMVEVDADNGVVKILK